MPTFLAPEEAPTERDGHFICPDCGKWLNTRRQPEPVRRIWFCRTSTPEPYENYGNCGAVFHEHVGMPDRPWERIPSHA